MASSSRIILPRIDTSNSWLLLQDESAQGQLVSTVAHVLGLERDSVQLLDSFSDLGGTQESATAVQKACMEIGIAVKTKDILQCPTLAELQTCISPCARQSQCQDSVESVMIAPHGIHNASRLSVADSRSRHSRHSSRSSSSSNIQQRTKVEEILDSHKLVSRITTTKPKAGLLEDKLVAFLTLSYYAPRACESLDDVHLISQSQMFFAGTQIATLRRVLQESRQESQQADIMPEAWVVLDEMPLTESGDIDRRRLRTWAQNMNEETYRLVMSLDTSETLQKPSTEMERSLQTLVGKVLQVPREQIGVNFTFSRLGGDELSAMELVARCKHQSINLDANEVLQGLTLADLAALVSQRGGLAHKWDEDRLDCFDLSPMQQLYVRTTMGGDARRRASGDGSYRFNQSFLLRLKKHYLLEDMLAAVETIVGHHSMLRSRFTLETGRWSQKIFPDVSGSYAFNYHSVHSNLEVEAAIERTQATINVESGPVFAVDYFQTNDGHQMIYLAAHHLVVDLPSWRIILHDLDELLEHGNLSSQRSMPFRRWIELQKSMLQGLGTSNMPSIAGGHYSDYGYWGLRDRPNTYGDSLEAVFSLSPEVTSALQTSCNDVFGTDPVEIYLAALLLSFAQTFHERPVPIVWNHEHGRQTWNPDIDISETVGWFTSLCPIVQRVGNRDDIVGLLRQLKDGRRSMPGRGSHFFASQFYNANGPGTFSPNNNPFEIVFSHAGPLQHLTRGDGILEQMDIPGRTSASSTADIGSGVGRIAVFEVSAVVDQGVANIKFLYSRYASLQDRISSWISNYEYVLLDAVSRLRYHAHELTLADVPHLDVTYDGLAKLNKGCLAGLNLASIRDVEAVYPVTSNQQWILVSQAQDPDTCFLHTIHQFTCPNGEPVDTYQLCSAWQHVSSRHAALRTVFTESVTQTGLYDQVVLRKISPDMLFIDAVPPDDPVDELNSLPGIRMDDNKPPHRLTVCRTPTRTLIKLDISTAICDTASVHTLVNDLWQIYTTQRAIPDPIHFSYSDYLEFLKTAREGESLAFWRKQLQGVQPCFFPDRGSLKQKRQRTEATLELDISTQSLTIFAETQHVSIEAAIRLAWGLILRSFTGMKRVCFAWQATGRDDLVTGSRQAVGSFANTIPCSMNLSPDDRIVSTLQNADKQLSLTSVHQYISIPEALHAVGLRGSTQLFNSCLLYTDEPADLGSDSSSHQDPELRHVSQQQSSPFEVSIHVRHSRGKLVVDICGSVMSRHQALGVATTFGQAIQAITDSSDGQIRSINLFSDRDYAQLVSWASEVTLGEREGGGYVVHDLVARHAQTTPHAAAVCAWDGELTYQQLVSEATKLAYRLVDAGAGPETVIPVILDKSRWAPVALLAVLQAGAAFVAIDSEDLVSIQAIADKLDANIAIVTRQAAAVIGNVFEDMIVLDNDIFSQLPHHSQPFMSIATPDDAACVLFPPATSKESKGIAFSHAAMSTAFLTQGPAARISSSSRVMQLSSFNADIALSEVFTTLVHGGCICVPSEYERLHDFAAAADRMEVNWTYMTPFLSRKLKPASLPTVKDVCFRTRNLDDDTYGQWTGKANVMLAYGTLDVCPLGIAFLDVTDANQLKCIGRPFAGSFWVVDPENNRRLVAIGAVGELIIESPTLGTSYPETEPVQSPVSVLEGNAGKKTRHFKTGHLVRYLEGGTVEFISSKRREELEINGRSFDIADMEKNIRRCLGQGTEVIVEAIAFGEETTTPPALVTFIEFGDSLLSELEDVTQLSNPVREKINIAKQLVQTGLRNSTESSLIPSIFIPVRQLPITQSLKVNRRRLQKMIRGLSREQLVAISDMRSPNPVQTVSLKPLPLTQGEERMRSIWAKMLDVDEKSIDASSGFISAGGDDVLASKLVVACRHAGITLCIADVLRNASLTELCRGMSTADESDLPEHYSSESSAMTSPEAARRASLTDSFVERIMAPKLGVDRMAIKDVVEASATQTRCIESGMLRGRANVDYFIFDLSGSVDWERLEEACQVLVTIHPILRTAFVPYNRQVYQAIVKSSSCSDFKRYSCPGWRQAALVEKIVKKDQSTPIAFSAPMTKFTLLDGGKSATLILRLCKAQYDDFSVALLVKDLKRLYDCINNPPRRPTFCDFIRCTHAAISQGAEEYWKTLLEGSKMTQVVGHTRPYQLSTNVKTLRARLTVGSLENLTVSFGTVLKSAWAMVLATLSGSSDVVFGEIIEGRHVKLEGSQSASSVLGPAANSIPVRVRFPDTSLTPLTLLEYVDEQHAASIPFENMGFLNVVEKCTLWPYWTRFSTVVQHQSQDAAVNPQEPKAFRLGAATCRLTVIEPGARDVHDLLVHSIARKHGGIELRLTFCADRVPESLVEQALRLLCETVNMLTSVSNTQPIIPSGYQYRAMEKRIPIPPTPTTTGAAPPHPLDVASIADIDTTTPLGPEYEANRLPEDQIRAIQTAISKAWSSVLKPRSLGVPEEHLHTAAFYDLWGSLIPAAQLAAHLNRELPRLGLGGLEAVTVTMEDVIDNPTMLDQFRLVARRMVAAAGVPTTTATTTTSATEYPATPPPPQSPSARRKRAVSMSVSASAATIGSRIRRLTGTIAHPAARSNSSRSSSSSSNSSTPEARVEAGLSGFPGFPGFPVGGRQTPQSAAMVPAAFADRESGSGSGSGSSSSAASMTLSMTAAGSSVSSRGSIGGGGRGGEEDLFADDDVAVAEQQQQQLTVVERALVPAPLRRVPPQHVKVPAAGFRGGHEDVVSPLSAASPGVGFWDVRAVLGGGGGGGAGEGYAGMRQDSDAADLFERMGLVSPIVSHGQ